MPPPWSQLFGRGFREGIGVRSSIGAASASSERPSMNKNVEERAVCDEHCAVSYGPTKMQGHTARMVAQ
eukprot:1274991-Lingulodinium_polyedra.AAC.1